MKLSLKHRGRWLIGGGLLLATAPPRFALFGLGDIVFDPSTWAEAAATATTTVSQLETFKNNITHFSFKGAWTTSLAAMKQASVQDSFGETDGIDTALNNDSPTAANTAWRNSTTTVDTNGSAYVAGLAPASAQRGLPTSRPRPIFSSSNWIPATAPIAKWSSSTC